MIQTLTPSPLKSGADWTIPVVIDGLNLSAATVTSQVRRHATAASTAWTWTVTVVDEAAGVIYLSLAKAASALVPEGRYFTDIAVQITGGARLLTITLDVIVEEEITHE